jgi:hypothetical protein
MTSCILESIAKLKNHSNSGHMVPYNQPENALDLLTRFLRNESFVDHVLPVYTADPLPRAAKREREIEKVIESYITWRDVLLYGVFLFAGFVVGYLVSKDSRRNGYESIDDKQ